MKKIILTLVALTAAMSMNAQCIKLMKNGEVVATYSASEADGVEYEEQTITGAVTRTGGIVVNWVQLWEDGPKFAEYNVGANSAEGDGGYYCWGGSINRDKQASKENICSSLSGDNDTATKLWGANWRMPTKAELQGLIDKCDPSPETLNGVAGVRYRGRGIYAGNSIFLPLTGDVNYNTNSGVVGYYYSSESDNDTKKPFYLREFYFLYNFDIKINTTDGVTLCSVRPVLTDGPLMNEYVNEDDNEGYEELDESATDSWL